MTARRSFAGLLAGAAVWACVAWSAQRALAADPASFSHALALDQAIDWRRAALIVVQEAGRYKTLESLARESMAAMYGRESLPGLSPPASLFEWLIRRETYFDTPLVWIKDRGLRIHLTEHLPEAARQRIRSSGYMTPRELTDQRVRQRLAELEPRFDTLRAIGRVRHAEQTAFFLAELMRIVPRPDAPTDARWYTPYELRTNAVLALPVAERPTPEDLVRRYGLPAAGVSPAQAASIVGPWQELEEAWRRGDAAGVQAALDRLADRLPTLAAPDVYPRESQRRAELRYYRFGKFAWGWSIYFLGALVSLWALVTRWRGPWLAALVLLAAGLGLHAYGLALRWYIVGRIPVANMFEALVASAWMGIAVAILVELVYRTRVFLLAAQVTGFFALLVAGYVIPGGGTITVMMGILDNVMLRLHTVMIIAAYALIFLAAVIAVVYLVGYYRHRLRAGAAENPVNHRAGERPPILAGALPGDEGRLGLPTWLCYTDWSHLIILNMAFVLLFVGGIVLGALWADYSWGRPWGWDPKEVFALNTWIVYAILIHTRLVVKRKGLWTAWLSLAGCATMLFNWFVVNYYIVGLHSYA